jgi:hypothetical protein
MTSNFLNRVSGNLQRVSLVAVGAIALSLGSCATPTPTNEAESPDATDAEVTTAPEDPLEVVTTFLPMTQFTTAFYRPLPYCTPYKNAVLTFLLGSRENRFLRSALSVALCWNSLFPLTRHGLTK